MRVRLQLPIAEPAGRPRPARHRRGGPSGSGARPARVPRGRQHRRGRRGDQGRLRPDRGTRGRRQRDAGHLLGRPVGIRSAGDGPLRPWLLFSRGERACGRARGGADPAARRPRDHRHHHRAGAGRPALPVRRGAGGSARPRDGDARRLPHRRARAQHAGAGRGKCCSGRLALGGLREGRCGIADGGGRSCPAHARCRCPHGARAPAPLRGPAHQRRTAHERAPHPQDRQSAHRRDLRPRGTGGQRRPPAPDGRLPLGLADRGRDGDSARPARHHRHRRRGTAAPLQLRRRGLEPRRRHHLGPVDPPQPSGRWRAADRDGRGGQSRRLEQRRGLPPRGDARPPRHPHRRHDPRFRGCWWSGWTRRITSQIPCRSRRR